MIDQRNCFRVMPGEIKSKLAYAVYLRHLFAYEAASGLLKDKKSIIEIGSGEGYGAAYLSNGPFDIKCFDLSESIAQHANTTYKKTNLSFQSFDGKKIPIEDNSFDAAISFQVIEHVDDVPAYLKEIKRVLKPGGIFLLTTPNRTYRLSPGQKPWNNYHLREYYDHELKNELKNHFDEANVWGVRGNDELQKMEHDRVKKSKNNSSLKKIIPFGIRKWLNKKIKGKSNEQNNDSDFLKKYSLNDYRIIKENVNENSLDLFGYCVK
jgi:ubiquinone/menaquinone biosynthesis C-methylase UbiE